MIPRTPKIILHTPEPHSGAAKYVAQLAIALHDAEVPVALFCPANFAYGDLVREAGIRMVLAPAREVGEAGLWRRFFRILHFITGSLREHVRSVHRGDVVHFQFPLRMPFGLLFYCSALLKGAIVVLTAHDPLPHRWRLPLGLHWLEHATLWMEYRACRALIVHNRKGCEVLRETFGLAAERVFLVPHGPDAHVPAATPFPEFSEFRILAFGSIRENKGLHFAIEAVQELRRVRSIPVRLTIAGSLETMAEGGYWQRCKTLIERAPETFEVIEGFFPDEHVSSLMASHHAVVLPYADFHSESGVAALALSHARPIVATSSGGLGELIDASGGGVPIARPDSNSVASAMAEAFAMGPERLEAMGVAGKRYLQLERSWERIAELTAEIYREAHSAGKRARQLPNSTVDRALEIRRGSGFDMKDQPHHYQENEQQGEKNGPRINLPAHDLHEIPVYADSIGTRIQ